MRRLFLWGILLLPSMIFAQELLRLNLDESGSTYIKANFRAQFWTRFYESNPNTQINGKSADEVLDFSIRRIRFGLQSQITPKLYFYSLMGGNNYNQKTQKKFAVKVLDMYVEYEFDKMFALGAGEFGWDAPSRWTVFSNKSMLSTDALVFALFTINKQDEEGRGLGIFAKGQIGKFDYHISVKSPPLLPNANSTTAPKVVTDYANVGNPKKRISTYLKYEFLDNESNKTEYSGATGTYLGTKRILNLGGGIAYQPDMMWQVKNGQTKYYDYKNWAVELFYDSPMSEKKDAVTAYLGYFDTNFGENYFRYVAPNNIAESASQANGYPMMGTGKTIFFQTGYLFPKFEKSKVRIQPNFSVQYSDFEGLKDKVVFYDTGINIYFNGQANKLSFGYQNRPVFDNNLKVSDRKGMFILQYQVELN